MTLRHYWAATALAFSIANAPPAYAERISLDWFGFSLDVPTNWQVLYRADEDQAVLGTGSPENYIDEASANNRLADILVLRPGDDSVAAVKLVGHDDRGRVGTSPMELIWGTVRYMEGASRDFKIVDAPEPASLGGIAGARARYHFVANADGKDYSLLCDLWIVPFHGRFLQIAATVQDDRVEILFRDARDIIRSVELPSADSR